MTLRFPRSPDRKGRAWGPSGGKPAEIWERFSPDYEAQAERLGVADRVHLPGVPPRRTGAPDVWSPRHVLLVVPPKDGYGSTGSPDAG